MHLGGEHENVPKPSGDRVDKRSCGRTHGGTRGGRLRTARWHDGNGMPRGAGTRTFARHDADEHRHDRGDDRAHRRGDAHGSDGETSVERHQADGARHPSGGRPRHVGGVGIATEERRDDDHEHQAQGLAAQNDGERGADPTGGQPAEEVARSIGGRAEKRQHDRHGRSALSPARRRSSHHQGTRPTPWRPGRPRPSRCWTTERARVAIRAGGGFTIASTFPWQCSAKRPRSARQGSPPRLEPLST